MTLPAPLVSERQDYSFFPTELGDDPPFGHGVGDRLVEEDVLARERSRERGLDVRAVRRGVDDRLDAAVLQNGLVIRRSGTTVLGGKGPPLLFGARVASDDLEVFGPLDRVGEDIRPPAHADAGDAQTLHLFWLRPYGFHRLPGDALVGRPVSAAHPHAADALAFDDDGAAAFHRGPALRSCSERESQRMREVEGLSLSAVRRGRTLVRRRAHRLGGG